MAGEEAPVRRSWRASKTLLVFTATLGLFTENFLYGFVVPILPYMIEARLGLDPAYTQRLTNELLFVMGLVSVPSAPIIGHFADKTTSRKIPLIISLIGCTIGTLLVATTLNLYAVYAGRILQGIAGTGAWIVGFAMLTDAAGQKNLGKALTTTNIYRGSAGAFITAGMLTGPVVSGALLQYGGYWISWSVPFGLLAICFLARFAMTEERSTEKTTPLTNEDGGENETAPLISEDSSNGNGTTIARDEPKSPPPQGFYRIMFSQPSTYAALFNVCGFSMIIAGFDTTLPIHLRNEFGWRPAPIGSIFLSIQVPAMVLAPFIGRMRDRIGLRWPTALGWLFATPLLWFLGVPSKAGFLGVGADTKGQASFVAAIITLGFVWSFVRGATMHELKAKDPYVFGKAGGSSRCFALTETSFAFGLVLGPLVTGGLADIAGFYWAMTALACFSASICISSWLFFTHKSPIREEDIEEES